MLFLKCVLGGTCLHNNLSGCSVLVSKELRWDPLHPYSNPDLILEVQLQRALWKKRDSNLPARDDVVVTWDAS